MRTTYIAGPWIYKEGNGDFIVSSKQTSEIIADVYGEPEAKLIAASTDLLNACIMAKNELCFGGDWANAIKMIDKAVSSALMLAEPEFEKEIHNESLGTILQDEEFERFHPESSQVSRTKYYEDMNVFEVEFKFGGKVYHYADVPFEVWIEAGKTDSIGSFVNKQIKPFYDYKQADDILFTPPPKSKTTEPKTLNTRGL